MNSHKACGAIPRYAKLVKVIVPRHTGGSQAVHVSGGRRLRSKPCHGRRTLRKCGHHRRSCNSGDRGGARRGDQAVARGRCPWYLSLVSTCVDGPFAPEEGPVSTRHGRCSTPTPRRLPAPSRHGDGIRRLVGGTPARLPGARGIVPLCIGRLHGGRRMGAPTRRRAGIPGTGRRGRPLRRQHHPQPHHGTGARGAAGVARAASGLVRRGAGPLRGRLRGPGLRGGRRLDPGRLQDRRRAGRGAGRHRSTAGALPTPGGRVSPCRGRYRHRHAGGGLWPVACGSSAGLRRGSGARGDRAHWATPRTPPRARLAAEHHPQGTGAKCLWPDDPPLRRNFRPRRTTDPRWTPVPAPSGCVRDGLPLTGYPFG